MIHKFHFNESVVGLLSATDFFYNTIDFSTGEIRKNKKDFFLCLDIVERVATNKNKKKLLSARALREIKTEYHPLFKAITDNQILLIIKKSTRKSATQVELNPLFVGECELELTQAQLDLVNVRFIKEKRRGTKATTAKEITIEITYPKFYNLMKENGKSNEAIFSQWLLISRINRTKKLNPRQKSQGRLYSNFTSLTSLIHPYTKINGKVCVEIDQHATYWTLLPKLFRDTLLLADNNIHEELLKDVEKLHTFISNTKNIYAQIAKETNQPLDEIKQYSISFICDPNHYTSNNHKVIIRDWFQNKFPFCSYHLDNLRRNNLVSYRIQSIESKIFVTASKELNTNGIDCFSKHDSIIVTKDQAKSAEATINKYMKKYNIPNKIRDKVLELSECHTPSSYDSSKLPYVSPEEGNVKKESYTQIKGKEEEKTICVTFQSNQPTTPILSAEQGTPMSESLNITSLNITKKKRNRASKVTLVGKYYMTGVDGFPYKSHKGETREQFIERVKNITGKTNFFWED